MSKSTKYTKELMEPIVKESFSLSEVIRKLGIKWSGGQQQNIKRWINIYEFDTSHFLGQGSNRGVNHKGGPDKKDWTQILVLMPDNNRRQVAFKLRRALIEYGREYKCCVCANPGIWLDKELVLQVNYKNGNWLDNRADNLEFICPNCHTQTPGWSGCKGKTNITSITKKSKYVDVAESVDAQV